MHRNLFNGQVVGAPKVGDANAVGSVHIPAGTHLRYKQCDRAICKNCTHKSATSQARSTTTLAAAGCSPCHCNQPTALEPAVARCDARNAGTYMYLLLVAVVRAMYVGLRC